MQLRIKDLGILIGSAIVAAVFSATLVTALIPVEGDISLDKFLAGFPIFLVLSLFLEFTLGIIYFTLLLRLDLTQWWAVLGSALIFGGSITVIAGALPQWTLSGNNWAPFIAIMLSAIGSATIFKLAFQKFKRIK